MADNTYLKQYGRILALLIAMMLVFWPLVLFIPKFWLSADSERLYLAVRFFGLVATGGFSVVVFARLYERELQYFFTPKNLERFHTLAAKAVFLLVLLHPLFVLTMSRRQLLGLSVNDLLHPWANLFAQVSYRFGLGLGVLAFYLIIIAALALCFKNYPWSRRLWNVVHHLSLLAYPLILWHAWSIGSELQYSTIQLLWLILAILYLSGLLKYLFKGRQG